MLSSEECHPGKGGKGKHWELVRGGGGGPRVSVNYKGNGEGCRRDTLGSYLPSMFKV